MPTDTALLPRQIWAHPTPTLSSLPRHCTPFRLPSGGYLAVGDDTIITLTQEAVFQPQCTEQPGFNTTPPSLDSSVFNDKTPFYASTSPQMYAIAAVTVVSYLLVIILFITPRTFFVGGSGGGGGFLAQRGMISGASGSTSVIGVGSRPWLQKVAALTVAISLTIATVDTFKVAEHQYQMDYSDATALTNEVVGSLELRIVRVISETCLWLAQAQTLIRLFPRHKEKVIIKWAGFVLIALDTIFSILNSFVSESSKDAPRKFQDAVPALSYLFTFCLSLIYAAWIIYYSLSKRRYAFIHPKMRNIFLVALLSYAAVLIPVVFFILDISIYNVAGWGNYVRWVGAAAASVVVWEWVERIETLERDERKDGILGREIFDGDEMLDMTPSSRITWSSSRRLSSRMNGDFGNDGHSWGGISLIAQKVTRPRQARRRRNTRKMASTKSHQAQETLMTGAALSNPLSTEASTTSRNGSIGQPNTDHTSERRSINETQVQNQHSSDSSSSGQSDKQKPIEQQPPAPPKQSVAKSLWDTLQKMPIPFLNRHMSPPIEVKQAVRTSQQPIATESVTEGKPQAGPTLQRVLWDRLGLRHPAPAPKAPLPVTIVPAPPRNTTSWNDIRFHAGSSRYSQLYPEATANQTGHITFPMEPPSRRSTPAPGSIYNRYSPVSAQTRHSSRGVSMVIPEQPGPTGAAEHMDVGIEAADFIHLPPEAPSSPVSPLSQSSVTRGAPEETSTSQIPVASTSDIEHQITPVVDNHSVLEGQNRPSQAAAVDNSPGDSNSASSDGLAPLDATPPDPHIDPPKDPPTDARD